MNRVGMNLVIFIYQIKMFKQAAFCYEELILISPYNYHIYETYAEILYSCGGIDNYRLARKYFAYSLELNQNSFRSLFGLFLAITASESAKQDKQDKDQKLIEWINIKVISMYKQQNPNFVPYLNRTLSKFRSQKHRQRSTVI